MTGDVPFALACCSLILVVGIVLLGRAFIRIARLTVDEIDSATEQGEC